LSRLVRLLLGLCLAVLAVAASSTSASAAVCADYSNQAAAQQAADTRDADSDGLYCEALPCPCSSGGGDDSSGGSTDDGAADRERRQAEARRREAAHQRRVAAHRREAARRRARARKRAAEHRERVARQRVERGTWRVSRVVEADVLRVRRTDGSASETVRLIGIDVPDGCRGPQALALTLALTFSAPADTDADNLLDASGGTGALVDLQTDRSQDLRDDDGRLLAYTDVVGDIPPFAGTAGYDVGKRLVATGLSAVLIRDSRFARQSQYEAAARRSAGPQDCP
jgi:hypothetical protein